MTTSLRRRLGPRLALAAAGFFVAIVPVTILGYMATHGWPPLRSVDQGTANRLHQWAAATPGAVSFMQWVSTVFHPWALRVVAIVAIALLIWRRQVRLAIWTAVAVIGAGVLDFVLKDVVRRARPHLPHAVASAPGFSFPSGHALSSLVAFGVALLLLLPLLSRGWRIVAWVVAAVGVVLVGFSRVALGVHFVSDVVAGWLIGLGWLGVTVAAFESWRRAVGKAPHDVLEGVDPAASHRAVSGAGHRRSS